MLVGAVTPSILLGLTGTALAWMHALDAALNPGLLRVTPAAGLQPGDRADITPAAIDALLARLAADARYGKPNQLWLPEHADAPVIAWCRRPPPARPAPFALEVSRQVMVDPATLQIVGERNWGEAGLSRPLLMPTLFHLYRYQRRLGDAGHGRDRRHHQLHHQDGPRADGTTHTLSARLSSQFRGDSLDWKTGYTLARKSDGFDLLGFVSLQQRGIGYDGEGRALGIETVQGDTMNAHGNDVFLKVGKTIGEQRLQATFNRFQFSGEGDYRNQDAVIAAGIPTSAVPGTPPGQSPRNKVQTASLDYRHGAVAGGAMSAQVFTQDFSSLYEATNVATFQDKAIAPPPSLYDQSEIVAKKYVWQQADLRAPGYARFRTRVHRRPRLPVRPHQAAPGRHRPHLGADARLHVDGAVHPA